MSNTTKKYKKRKNICLALIILLNVIPMLVFVIEGYVKGTPKEKMCLSITAIVSLLLLILNVLFKSHLRRTILVVLFAGIYICMKDLKMVFIIYGISTLLDEMVLTPLHSYYKDRYSNNKDIDKRIEEMKYE